jgi:hypothetical protein
MIFQEQSGHRKRIIIKRFCKLYVSLNEIKNKQESYDLLTK